MMRKIVILVPLLLPATYELAEAQFNNAPFAFRASVGGIGMSVGGRQAILNEKIDNNRPDNLLRGPGGDLLDVRDGPGGSAIVTQFGTGNFIPAYRGASFSGDNPYMSVGVFNSFFVPRLRSAFVSYAQEYTAADVNTWTGRVVTNQPVSYRMDDSTVDTWTSQVYTGQ